MILRLIHNRQGGRGIGPQVGIDGIAQREVHGERWVALAIHDDRHFEGPALIARPKGQGAGSTGVIHAGLSSSITGAVINGHVLPDGRIQAGGNDSIGLVLFDFVVG